jgi:hypothetical protein
MLILTETFFSTILSADGHALASKVEKKGKKIENFQYCDVSMYEMTGFFHCKIVNYYRLNT